MEDSQPSLLSHSLVAQITSLARLQLHSQSASPVCCPFLFVEAPGKVQAARPAPWRRFSSGLNSFPENKATSGSLPGDEDLGFLKGKLPPKDSTRPAPSVPPDALTLHVCLAAAHLVTGWFVYCLLGLCLFFRLAFLHHKNRALFEAGDLPHIFCSSPSRTF